MVTRSSKAHNKVYVYCCVTPAYCFFHTKQTATTLGGVRTGYGGSSSTDRCGESSPSPPQWQRIAALNHGLPVKRLRAPSGCDGAYEGCWQSDDPQYDGSGRGGEVMGCSSGGYLVRGGGERYRGQGSAGPEPESGYYRADYSGREVSSRR